MVSCVNFSISFFQCSVTPSRHPCLTVFKTVSPVHFNTLTSWISCLVVQGYYIGKKKINQKVRKIGFMKVKGAGIILVGRRKLVGGLLKVFKCMKGYCMETGNQLFSLLLRREQKEMVFNFSRGGATLNIGKNFPKKVRFVKHWNGLLWNLFFWRCLEIRQKLMWEEWFRWVDSCLTEWRVNQMACGISLLVL